MALNNMTTTASYGVVRDHLAFYNALVPKQKTSVAPRAVVPLCDTVLLLKGKPQRWLCSDAKQEATEKMHVDKESIHATFRQYALGNPNNAAKLVSVIRRMDGTYEVLNAEDTAEFMKASETPIGLTAVAIQKYVHAKGGDRAIFRNTYDQPIGAVVPTFSTVRYPEFLSPELSQGRAGRSEFAPIRSYQDTINSVLDEYTRRSVVQIEGALRCKVTFLALDYVIDERDNAVLLWPFEMRTVEISKKDGQPIPPQASSSEQQFSNAAGAGLGRGSGAGAYSQQSQHHDNEEESGYPSGGGGGGGGGGAGPDWVRDKARAFEAEQQREADMQSQYNSLVDKTIGSGERGHILIVDSDPVGVLTAVNSLVPSGYAVTIHNDGPKALSSTRTLTFDCVLLARDLPSLSGLEVTKILRQREASMQATRPAAHGSAAYHIPIVAFTHSTEPDDLRLYMEAGMDGCVSKPVDVNALLNTMAAAIPVPAAPRIAQQVPHPQQQQANAGRGGRTSTTQLSSEPSSLPSISNQQQQQQRGRQPAAQQQQRRTSDIGSNAAHGPPTTAWASAPTTPAAEFSPFAQGQGINTSQLLEGLRQGQGPGGGLSSLSQGSFDEQAMQMANSAGGAQAAAANAAGGHAGVRGARALAQARKGAVKQPAAKSASPNRRGSVTRRRSTGNLLQQEQQQQQQLATGFDPVTGQVHMPSGAAIPGIQPPVSGMGQGGRVGDGAMPPPPAPVLNQLPTTEDEDGSHLGIFQLDAETAIPYCVMGKKRPGVPLFHFVVIGDIFDTYESYQILFRQIVNKLPGLRVLLFNYPGQAFTEWRRDIVLNNEYQAGVLQALMTYLGPGGTREFDLDGDKAPFYLIGSGNGGAIASYFAAAYHGSHPNLRSLVMINGFAHVDAHYAGVMHDCMNVFACSPVTRPDLPVYFFARFLFSPTYLQKVGAPLALNMYTAVSNPISLQGRIALCQGALSHVDCRHALESLTLPMIVVASSKDGLVKPSHVSVMVEARGGEVRSIKRALSDRARAVVIWLRCGHEVFQEARKPMVNLFEQLATGYHERNDVAFLPLVPDDVVNSGAGGGSTHGAMAVEAAKTRAAAMAAQTSALQSMNLASAAAAHASDPLKPIPGARAPQQLFEDKFLDNVVSTMRGAAGKGKYPSNPVDAAMASQSSDGRGSTLMQDGVIVTGLRNNEYQPALQYGDVPDALELEPEIPEEVLRFGRAGSNLRRRSATGRVVSMLGVEKAPLTEAERKKLEMKRRVEARAMTKKMNLDPELTAFEARDKELQAARAKGNITSYATGDVKEYMSWRIRRNKKRLLRIEACAVTIQRAWRAYLARTLVSRMRQQRAALDAQRWWRGCLARKAAKIARKEMWAARVVQRYWRGFQGRSATSRMQSERRAAQVIQRNWRGYRARKFVRLVRDLRRTAAIKIQAAWRRFLGQRQTWIRRDQRNASINIQRIWRGYLGRARASKERDRYLFSKSQAQGIEFGRQMLMEHKLHGTKLQSEVSLLTKEKLATEEKIEAVLAEIATFEQGVRALEKEMVELSRAEAEAAGTLDEEAKIELRENKIRLDREFAAMLVKIADRRETLTALEGKLQTIDRARLAKKEELKDLERKLVVLLEQQQQELQSIRMRQERRSENVVEDAVNAVTQALKDKDPGQTGAKYLLADGSVSNTAAPGAQLLLADGTLSANTLGRTLGQTGPAGHGGAVVAAGSGGQLALGNGGGGVHIGPTPQQRAEAQALMASTETMMKFGFMSMSLTYFSSLNMVRAMRQMGTANTMLASNPMLALIGQMGAAATGGGNPAAVALAAAGGGGGGMPMLGNGSMGGHQMLALTAGTAPMSTLPGALGAAQSSASASTALAASLGGTASAFIPGLKPGQLPGQEAPELALWTVGDVSSWLETLALGQYKDSFADAAVDGAFLSELTDDDLRNTLGIEHALHRKKIITSILKLRQAEQDKKAQQLLGNLGGNTSQSMMVPGSAGGVGMGNLGATAGLFGATGSGSMISPTAMSGKTPMAAAGSRVNGFATSNQLQLDAAEAAAATAAANRDAGILKLDELMSWVRHNKGKMLQEALSSIPDGRFDPSLVKAQYLASYGTQYIDMLNGPAFHVNKPDDKGNTLLLVASQNGRQKVAQMLIRKGANPNHQNAQGNTAMHYAMAYKFHELAAWLADPEKGGASDEVQNAHGMGPYDGLAPE